MKAKTKAKKTIKKVASKLQKASKAHAGQAKALSKLKLSKGSSVNKAGNYTKPTMRKRLFQQIKSGGKGGAEEKIKILEKAGITMTESPADIGKILLNKLSL